MPMMRQVVAFLSWKASPESSFKNAAKENGEKSGGLRDTAEAKRKKRNNLYASNVRTLLETAAFGRGSSFEWSRAGMTS
ncbi:hypothetical protein J2X83_004579 [Brevibacillus nitrificans]|nr:hypothetical protein [Brevibacillus nitrificans]